MSLKPKRALIAYCVLAERLSTPGMGPLQALTPFLSEACHQFEGDLFDAAKFADALADHYGIRIPRLAALGLAEQLEKAGLLSPVSKRGSSMVYRYTKASTHVAFEDSKPVTESEVEAVLNSFVAYCSHDARLDNRDEEYLHKSFLDRLLNLDSMKILGRREDSKSVKKAPTTLTLPNTSDARSEIDTRELHLDFLVSQFLLDLREKNPVAFEQVSNVAFANMAAEAIACFRDPPNEASPLDSLTVFLDSPLLLDMLGVNTEYAGYGQELLEAIRSSGAKPAVLDHCVTEAEAAVSAQLNSLRSGINQLSSNWGFSGNPEHLAALVDNVADRAESRLKIEIHRDPETSLHRRSQSTVGDIEADMERRMLAWRNTEAKEYDRRSVWVMLAIRDTVNPSKRICDAKWLLLTRNTPLVSIANDAWSTWLKGVTRHSKSSIDSWSPVAMSDKQFAGYLWARKGGADRAISKARLLAHCSAAVRPRADIKARAYNLVLELNGKAEADDLAVLLEDREGSKALMRATTGDPEDVTRERLPFILEQVKLGAGEFAAAKVREESQRELERERDAHQKELQKLNDQQVAEKTLLDQKTEKVRLALLQKDQEQQELESENTILKQNLAAQITAEGSRVEKIIGDGFSNGCRAFNVGRWCIALFFCMLTYHAARLSIQDPDTAVFFSAVIGLVGFWFVPDYLLQFLNRLAYNSMQLHMKARDSNISPPPISKTKFKKKVLLP